MNKSKDDLDALFDEEGKGEDLDNAPECDAAENENEDGIDELLALIDEDGNENDQQKEESSKLEDEYLELQKKMKEIEEKMHRKKSISPKSKEPVKTPESSSSFLEAFASASFATENKSASSPKFKSVLGNTRSITEPPYSKRPADNTLVGTEVPPQKKRRITHPVNQSVPPNSGHPFTEDLRNGSHRPPMSQNHTASQSQNPALKKNKPAASGPCVVEIERYSRIRMKKCFVSGEEMKGRMEGKRFLRLSLIRSTMTISEDVDWVTVGVIAKQIVRETAKNGKPFSIWNLTDLDDCTKTVTFFLFGKVHEQLYKQMAVGSVIGVLNPSIMPPKKDETANSFDNTPALTVDVAERVMHIGLSTDLGWCTATKWRNKQPAGTCLAFINKQVSDVCVFHMKAKYKKSSSRRSELQGSAAAPIAQKYKDTMWNKVKNDQFFYGGKVYSAKPSSMGTGAKQKEPKVKLTKFLSNHAGLAEESKKEMMEKSKVMKALSGIEEDHSVSGCSNAFADMLSSGDNAAGSRQYLNHLKKMQKEEEDKKKGPAVKPMTAAELLRQQKDVIQEKKKKAMLQEKLKENIQASRQSPQPRQSMSLLSKLKQSAAGKKSQSSHTFMNSPVNGSMSPAEMRRKTAEMIKAKKLELSQKGGNSPSLNSPLPKLGQGLSCQDDIDLFGDWMNLKKRIPLQETAEMKKKKAIAKLRNDNGKVSITKEDPNKGVLRQIKSIQNNDRVQEKILGKVGENRPDIGENKENECDEELEKTKSKMSKEEFERILNTHSSHSDAVEEAQLEENEKYFNPLIKKEMMEKKMAETFEVSCKTVTCIECSYTFWGPHERCKQLKHHLHWQSAKKKFFQCSQCKRRTSTWETYPSRPCSVCGSEKNWNRTSMLKEKDIKVLDNEVLLIRGLEHGRFINSLA